MTIEKTLSVQKREGSGKGPAGRARTQDMIPGVFYTAKGDNIAVQAPALPLEKMYAEMGRTAVFNLEIDDNGTKTVHPVMFWEVQKHPYKKAFTHVDFYGVDLDKAMAELESAKAALEDKSDQLSANIQAQDATISKLDADAKAQEQVVEEKQNVDKFNIKCYF